MHRLDYLQLPIWIVGTHEYLFMLRKIKMVVMTGLDGKIGLMNKWQQKLELTMNESFLKLRFSLPSLIYTQLKQAYRSYLRPVHHLRNIVLISLDLLFGGRFFVEFRLCPACLVIRWWPRRVMVVPCSRSRGWWYLMRLPCLHRSAWGGLDRRGEWSARSCREWS